MPDTARAHRAKSESMDEIFSNPSCSLVVSGGYMLGEQLFFTGPNETFANGDACPSPATHWASLQLKAGETVCMTPFGSKRV